MSNSKRTVTDIKRMLLDERDKNQAHLKNMTDAKHTLLTVAVNMPSYPKNTPVTRLIRKLFNHEIAHKINPVMQQDISSEASDYTVFQTTMKPELLKNHCLNFEETHPLGRFVDLDVYDQKGSPLSRAYMNLPPRKCYICHKAAHHCARNQTHPSHRLHETILKATRDYIHEYLCEQTAHAMQKEAFMYPKFGLVSPQDSGVHKDMDITLLLKSIDALKPYFKQFAQANAQDFYTLRKLGVEAEQAMFTATNHVNTHKGAIFIFGAFLPFYAEGLLEGQTLKESVHTMMRSISPHIEEEFKSINQKETLSAGESIYLKYGIKGIRGEVSKGFPSVFSWHPTSTYGPYEKLCALMMRLEDTTIIKRKNLSTLKRVQEDMKVLLSQQPFSLDMYRHLSELYKQEGISPGGSADLLALVFLLEQTAHLQS